MVWLTTLTGWVLLIANFLRHGLRSSSRWLTSSSSPSSVAPKASPDRDNKVLPLSSEREAVKLPPLSPAENATVAAGRLITKAYRNDGGVNRGVACQMINAPPSAVLASLLDFKSYPRMVDDVQKAEILSETAAGDVRVHIRIGYGPFGLGFDLHHVVDRRLGQVTWSLDRERGPSMFKSNDGFWVVQPGPTQDSSVVYYSIAVELNGWVPSWVNGFVASQGIPRAVAWVKKESESRTAAAEKAEAAAAYIKALQQQKHQQAAEQHSVYTVPPHPLARCLLGCFGATS